MAEKEPSFCPGYGKAPQPFVPKNFIKASPPSDGPPGLFLEPATINKQQGFVINRYYFVKSKDDGSFFTDENGLAQMAPLFKEHLPLTARQAHYLIHAMVRMLGRFGYDRAFILAEPQE